VNLVKMEKKCVWKYENGDSYSGVAEDSSILGSSSRYF
jgi:hypothetical protein